ncbi:Myb/SANT-like domain [Macleaya cordata]|uniref:Myb/SANT-like domain n=1 Tax=Macleaya cordata TaxID=56857 RepID=A0A200QQD5_MACCD|nr:Myb/SANT-like domain [Macleaya cordata]
MPESILALPIPRKQRRESIKNVVNERMDNQPRRYQSKQDLSRARWTTSLTEKFATLLIEQIAQGNRSNNVFSKKAWKYVRNEFNKQTGHNFDRKQLKNHLDVLRKRYNTTKSLLDQGEFRWDESQQMVIADKEVWARYIKAHPEAESIKIKGCPIFKLLCLVFSESGVDGRDSPYKIQPAMQQIGGQHDQHQFEQDQSRARWTEPLDKIFTDLMVEQVLQGNKMNNTFNKKAWKYIHDEFNRQTGLIFNRKQLKNHHNVLRRLYNNMKSLLDQNDFSWDETQCMVIAEDEVWEKYVMAHPEAEAIRIKGCPIYKKLCTLFSEPVSGRYAQSSHDFESDKAMDIQPNQHQTKQDRSRTKWTATLDKIFVDLVLEQVLLGNWSNNVFNKKSWKHICDEFNRQAGLEFNKKQLKKHLDVLRNRYYTVKSQFDQNGFGGDESRQVVMSLMTGDEVWDDYIETYPVGETTKIKDCPIYDQLCQIFSEPGGIGRYAQSSHYIELDKETVGMETPQLQACPVTPSTFVQDDSSSRSGADVNVEAQNKRKSATPSGARPRKRNNNVFDDAIAEAMLEMATASKLRAEAVIQSDDRFSITKCVQILDEMPGLDEGFYLNILDLFEDPNLREIFISLKNEKRLTWLQGKCTLLGSTV